MSPAAVATALWWARSAATLATKLWQTSALRSGERERGSAEAHPVLCPPRVFNCRIRWRLPVALLLSARVSVIYTACKKDDASAPAPALPAHASTSHTLSGHATTRKRHPRQAHVRTVPRGQRRHHLAARMPELQWPGSSHAWPLRAGSPGLPPSGGTPNERNVPWGLLTKALRPLKPPAGSRSKPVQTQPLTARLTGRSCALHPLAASMNGPAQGPPSQFAPPRRARTLRARGLTQEKRGEGVRDRRHGRTK